MNNTDKEYLDLLRLVLNKGKTKKNRTNVDTLGVFGAQARFNLQEGFSLLTTKKLYTKGIIHELLWFLSGSTNIKYLVDNGVNIWNKDAYRGYKNTPFQGSICNEFKNIGNNTFGHLDLDEFIDRIKNDDSFAAKWGDLGEGTYGNLWRSFPYYYEGEAVAIEDIAQCGYVDQIQKVIDKLKTNPDDRRMIVTAWHPQLVDHCVLPPCHCLFHFNTEELTAHERYLASSIRWEMDYIQIRGEEWAHDFFDKETVPRRRLNCLLYQRSCDLFLGVPFNIASYSLLIEMVAQCVNMVPGEFIHTYGDLHLYKGHLPQVEEQLSREPKELPKLVLNRDIKNIFDFKYEDINIVDYNPHPAIKAELFV